MTWTLILLLVAAVILVIGLIRVILNPYHGILGLIGDLLLIDLLCDLIAVVFEAIGNLLD